MRKIELTRKQKQVFDIVMQYEAQGGVPVSDIVKLISPSYFTNHGWLNGLLEKMERCGLVEITFNPRAYYRSYVKFTGAKYECQERTHRPRKHIVHNEITHFVITEE